MAFGNVESGFHNKYGELEEAPEEDDGVAQVTKPVSDIVVTNCPEGQDDVGCEAQASRRHPARTGPPVRIREPVDRTAHEAARIEPASRYRQG